MKGITNFIQKVVSVAKYMSILIIIGETFEFFSKKLAEKFPESSQNQKND